MPIIGRANAKAEIIISSRYKDPDVISQILEKREGRLKKNIEDAVGKVVAEFFKRNKVYKALTNPNIGILGEDLPAEFGLTDAEAKIEAGAIINRLVDSVHGLVEVAKTRNLYVGAAEAGVEYLRPKDYEDWFYTALSYTQEQGIGKTGLSSRKKRKKVDKLSGDSGHVIRWGKWMMNPKSRSVLTEDLPDINDYGIIYDLHGKENTYSKSGRALMGKRKPVFDKDGKVIGTKLDPRITHFPYEIPSILKPPAGEKNFVEGVAHMEQFQAKVLKALISEVTKELEKRS